MARIVALLLVGALAGCDQSAGSDQATMPGPVGAAHAETATSDPAATDLDNPGLDDPATPPPEVDPGADDGTMDDPPVEEEVAPSTDPCIAYANYPAELWQADGMNAGEQMFLAKRAQDAITCEILPSGEGAAVLAPLYGVNGAAPEVVGEFSRIVLEKDETEAEVWWIRDYDPNTGELDNEVKYVLPF